MKKNILVVAAHPDDEVLGCGGTIIKHIKVGDNVHLIVFTDGVTSREYKAGMSEAKLKKMCSAKIRARKKEFYKAASIMGIKKSNISFHDFPDNRMDSVPLLDIIKRIEDVSSKIKFDIVYTHHWGDLNIDHRKCLEAAITVFRPKAVKNKKAAVYCFEISGNMDLLPPHSANDFNPGYFVDISGEVNDKEKALLSYKSEMREYPFPVSVKSALELSAGRGKKKGVKFAEAFEEVKIK